MKEEIEKLYKIILESNRIVFFSGAGVSVASGIPDFRGEKGIYRYVPEEMVSHHFFLQHPKEFFDFYIHHLVFLNAKPNAAHQAIAYLESIGKVTSVITQNIDGLHQKAGSQNVIELHGSIYRNHCMRCHRYYDIHDMHFSPIPYCSCGGIIKPDVVLYEERLNDEDIENAIEEIQNADTLIIIGTSLSVYPAASFIQFFNGKHLIVINLDDTHHQVDAELWIHGRVEDYLNMDNIEKYLK